ncbi:DUF975 family protein [Paenibacillus thalictri]|uniref:DUF975 family protein n=1 Tax=Paenibacillus thalictri TaxID=2527873 RepID=A0A4Q9DGQ3_9BACL|nr:DUF975 family protein [Paenibacillus thalictri]TBL70886.1 DUF975 family protein [Paenibacillus thalictri]
MWERHQLKSKAKEVLRTSYWKAFLVSLILAVAVDGCSYNFSGSSSSSGSWFGDFDMDDDFSIIVALLLLIFGIVIFLLTLAFRIFVASPLEVGGRRYFVRAAEDDVNLNYIGYAFSRTKYLDIVKAMLWRGLLNFLWFLLLIIPGIVKYYAYSMVPYILADNPNIGYRRAVELSNRMTTGQKLQIWVLDLSFIGWYLLGILALFIGVLFILPYYNGTKAELYLSLRQKALDEGTSSYEELNLTPPPYSY